MVLRAIFALALLLLLFQLVRLVKRALEQGEGGTTKRSAREVLGVSSHATADEVGMAYRKLVAQYHPDKVASSAPELQELAARRLREINAAYAKLSKR